MSDIFDLKSQLEITIKALESKIQTSSEPIINRYLDKYQQVLKIIESGASNESVRKLAMKLLNCARGYMETSSDYQQNFLIEMSKTEKLVKELH